MKKNIFITTAGIILAILSLIFFITSFSFYNDGFGKDLSFDSDYLVLLICSIILVLIGVSNIKNKTYNTKNMLLGSFVIGVLFSFYNLGIAFKMISKSKEFIDYYQYFIYSLFGFIILSVTIYKYKKNN